MTKEELVEKLEELCVDIFAHADNDYEITLAGNGTNPAEASNVATAILSIVHGNGREWIKNNTERIEECATELRQEYGEE